MSTERQRFLIVMAMRGEAKPIAHQLGLNWDKLTTLFSPLPRSGSKVFYKNNEVAMAINGVDQQTGMDMIGTQAATVTALTGIQRFRPTHVLNLEPAELLRVREAKIGDLVLASDRVWFHTRRIPISAGIPYGLGAIPPR